MLGEDAPEELSQIAKQIRKLREEPDSSSEEIGQLTEGDKYWLTDRSEGWIKVELANGTRGWTSVSAFCSEICAKVLNAADFVIDLMRYVNYKGWEPRLDALTNDAAVVSDQILVIDALRRGNHDRAMGLTSSRLESSSDEYSAIFANFEAVILAKTQSIDGDAGIYLMDQLARASLNDPGNTDTLRNLATLFRVYRDAERTRLAVSLFDGEMIKAKGRRECVSIAELQDIGWTTGDPRGYCEQLGYDGLHSTQDRLPVAKFCYQGDELACIIAIDSQVVNY